MNSFLVFFARRSLRRTRSTMRLYEALVEQEPNQIKRELYMHLATLQGQRVTRVIARLSWLNAVPAMTAEPLTARLWRNLLVGCGARYVLAWIDFLEMREMAWTDLVLSLTRSRKESR
jgi:hypothetical protein